MTLLTSDCTNLQRMMANEVLRELRTQGLTQVVLATRTGLSQKHVSQMLTGRRPGSFRSWVAMAEAAQRSWRVDLA